MNNRILCCVVIYLISVGLKGAVVTQFPKHRIVGPGKELTLQCLQDMNYVLMYWYRQDPGFGLQLIYYSTGARNFEKGDVPQGYRVSRKDLQSFSLTLESASTNQTSVYLCTSSEPQRCKDVSSLHKKGASQGGRGPRLQEP
uniref:Ig-like domain-containing protein n=1 Tax=Mustela putorius furo TaxID=9669 RepID=M3YAV2_MUSPF